MRGSANCHLLCTFMNIPIMTITNQTALLIWTKAIVEFITIIIILNKKEMLRAIIPFLIIIILIKVIPK